MKLFYLAIFALMCGCVTATVSDLSYCASSSLIFVPVQNEAGTVIASTQIDNEGFFSSLTRQGQLELEISQNNLFIAESFAQVENIRITIRGINNRVDFPIRDFVNQKVNSSDDAVELVSLLDNGTIQSYLLQGTVELQYTIRGKLSANNASHTLCLLNTVSIHKGF